MILVIVIAEEHSNDTTLDEAFYLGDAQVTIYVSLYVYKWANSMSQ